MSPKLLVDIFSFWMVEFKGFSVKRILGRGFQLGLAKMYPLRLKAGESMLDRLIFSSIILSLISGSFLRKDKVSYLFRVTWLCTLPFSHINAGTLPILHVTNVDK